MKKKRKYTRKQDALEPISSPVKEESSQRHEQSSSTIPQVNEIKPSIKAFSFSDLPLSIRMQVENAIKLRKRLGLPDDSKERKQKAIKYFRGERPR